MRIKSATEEVVGTGDDKEHKLVVWFTNDERGLVLNRTNNRVLRGAFGDVVDSWAGKIIVVFPTTVDFRGKLVPALRVRIPPPKQAAAATPSQPTSSRKRSCRCSACTGEPLRRRDPEAGRRAGRSRSADETGR